MLNKPTWETLSITIVAPRQKLKKSGTQDSWQGITLSNALIIFFVASKLWEEMLVTDVRNGV